MFSNSEEKYNLKQAKLVAKYQKIQATRCENCLKAGNTEATIRETFKFIKEKQELSAEKTINVNIIMGIWIQESQTERVNNNVFTNTIISGVVTNVCESYAELMYTNRDGKLIKTVVAYDGMVYIFCGVINEYFEEYVARISMFPPLCKGKHDENYQVLKKLSQALEVEASLKTFELLLDGVLAGGIREIAIVRNLILINELFVIPVTSISGYVQAGKC